MISNTLTQRGMGNGGQRSDNSPTTGLSYSRILLVDLASKLNVATDKNIWIVEPIGPELEDVGPRTESIIIYGQIYDCDTNTLFKVSLETTFDGEKWWEAATVFDSYAASAPAVGVTFTSAAYTTTSSFNRHFRFRLYYKSNTQGTTTQLKLSLMAAIKTSGV